MAWGGLKCHRKSDTCTSATGGVATGTFVRAHTDASGTAIGLLDAGTAALVGALQTQLLFFRELVVTVTAVAMNAANGDGSSGSGPAGGNQADTYGTPPNGASPPPNGDGKDPLNQSQRRAVNKIENIIDNFKESDIDGVIRDLQNDPVPKPNGGTWNHLQEVQDFARGLDNHIQTLDGVNNAEAVAARNSAIRLLNRVTSAVRNAGFSL